MRFNKIDETDDMIKRKTFIIFDPRNREIEEKILNKTQNNSVVIKFEYVFFVSLFLYNIKAYSCHKIYENFNFN